MEENRKVKIHVSHLKKSFGSLEVLKDINTDIYEGEVVVVLGPSGSGKSTFLRCINRLEDITSGDVIVDGINVSDKKTDINKVRENVGMVFQHFNLFNNLDVMGNMILAPVETKKAKKAEAKENALKLLERVGLQDKVNAFPAQLSGGQKQRVAIARALVNNPDILLADEPTGALDTETSVQVMELLKEVAKERGVTIIDLYPNFTVDNEKGEKVLNPDWTRDGLHISQDGYAIWSNLVREYLK